VLPDAAGGLCPTCLLRQSLTALEAPEPERGEVEAAGFAPPTPRIPTERFGDYRLEGELGRGGMGIIYRAHQLSLNREVALKMIMAGPLSSADFGKRLRVEAEAAASLDHPNIVPIYEVGEHAGQPFYTMRLVEGTNLAQALKAGPFQPERAARLMVSVVRAIQHAHERGVLHRDLKPSNILLDTHEQWHVADFGLAKIAYGDSSLTLSRAALGTPCYMAPEQASAGGKQVTTAADIYGLGAILYEVLTGRPLFRADTPLQIIQQVIEREPERPSRLNPGIDRDLETICLKCLNKDPKRRYASASALAEDLECWLASKPVQARPVTSVERVWLWCRRKPVVAGMSAAVILLVLTVTVVSLTAVRRIAAEAQRAEEKARELRLHLYVADMNVAYQAIQDNDLSLARRLINNYKPEARQSRDGTARLSERGKSEDLRGWEWRYLWKLSRGDAIAVFRGHTNRVSCTLFSPDGTTLVTASFEGELRIWDKSTRKLRQCLKGFASSIQRNSIAFSPNGDLLAVADGVDIHVFAATNWFKVRTLPNPALPGRVSSLPIVFSPDGKTLMCNAHGELRQWDTRTWERREELLQSNLLDFGSLLAFSPDGRQFAIATDEAVLVCDASEERTVKPLFKIAVWWPMCIVFSPDSKFVAVGGPTYQPAVWDAKAGKEMARLDHGLPLAFSPDSKRLATAGSTIELWEMGQPTPIASLKGYGAIALAFAPDGQTIASGNEDGTVALWGAKPEAAADRLSFQGQRLGFSPDGRMLAVLGATAVEYWHLDSRTLISSFKLPGDIGTRVRVVASPDVRLLATVDTNGVGRVWDSRSRQTTAQINLNHMLRWPWADISPDNRFVAVSCESLYDGGVGWAGVWDLERGQVRDLPHTNCYRPTFSADGRILATGSNNEVQLWSLPDLKPLRAFSGHRSTVKTLAFSSDSAVLASTDRFERGICLWDVASGKLIRFITTSTINTLSQANAFSRDGRTIASCEGNDAMLWNVASGKPLFKMPGLGSPTRPPLFSPDGNRLVAGGSPIRMGVGSTIPVEVLEAPSLEEIDAAEGL